MLPFNDNFMTGTPYRLTCSLSFRITEFELPIQFRIQVYFYFEMVVYVFLFCIPGAEF